MTRVLIACDESDDAVRAAAAAHKLFGDAAEYFLINVGLPPLELSGAAGWGIASPLAMPLAVNSSTFGARAGDGETQHDAQEHAAEVAREADLDEAQALGDVGDPATAILDAATQHQIDVIVVGSRHHGWFDRLVSPSVSRAVLRASEVPVLVVPQAER